MGLQQRVNEALARSAENGYRPEKMTAAELAVDLTTFDPDLESYPVGAVQAAVQNWLDEVETRSDEADDVTSDN